MINPFVKGLRLFYYINTHILCMCVCVSVISDILGTGHCSVSLLAPLWRALPGELCQLFLELIGCLRGIHRDIKGEVPKKKNDKVD